MSVSPIKSRELFKSRALHPPIQIIRSGNGFCAPGFLKVGRPKRRQTLGVWEWQRPPQNGFDHAENGSARTDAERQSDNGHNREAWTLPQHAHAVTQVLQQRLDETDSACIPTFFLGQFNSAELHARPPLRLLAT